MRILHLVSNYHLGGASIACSRLHNALLSRGLDSHILCQKRDLDGERIRLLPVRTPLIFRRILKRMTTQLKRLQLDSTSHVLSLNFANNNLVREIYRINPDIVHIHWVGSDFLKIEDLPKINFPIVWTLHDMWPFCGAEHVSYSSVRWKNGYTSENRSSDARGLDLNRWVWNRKLKSWKNLTINTIGVSTWIDECLRSSRLFQEIEGSRAVIPNGLDETVFRPYLPTVGLEEKLLGKPFRVGFGAVKQSNKIKGGDLLLRSLSQLKTEGLEIELATFGSGVMSGPDGLGLKVVDYGRIERPEKLAQFYNTIDLMVVPSRVESFGQTAAEAMACCKPVVCFDTSGLQDIVVHKITGYRADCFDSGDLANGIRWCLNSNDRLTRMGSNARNRVIDKFTIARVAAQTHEFYQHVSKQTK